MAALQMREERRGIFPPVVQAVDIGNGHLRQFFFGDALQAPYVDTVHLSNGRLIAHTEGTDAAVLAKEVLVLLRVEEVLRHLPLARQQAKALRLRNCRPETVSPADR